MSPQSEECQGLPAPPEAGVQACTRFPSGPPEGPKPAHILILESWTQSGENKALCLEAKSWWSFALTSRNLTHLGILFDSKSKSPVGNPCAHSVLAATACEQDCDAAALCVSHGPWRPEMGRGVQEKSTRPRRAEAPPCQSVVPCVGTSISACHQI